MGFTSVNACSGLFSVTGKGTDINRVQYLLKDQTANLYLVHYSRTPLFRSPKGNGKKFEIAGLRNNRGSVKGKGKSKGIRSSFEIAGTSN